MDHKEYSSYYKATNLRAPQFVEAAIRRSLLLKHCFEVKLVSRSDWLSKLVIDSGAILKMGI